MTEEIRNEKGLPHGSEGGPVSSDHQEQGQASNSAERQEPQGNGAGNSGNGGGGWGGSSGRGKRRDWYRDGEQHYGDGKHVDTYLYLNESGKTTHIKKKYEVWENGKRVRKYYPVSHEGPGGKIISGYGDIEPTLFYANALCDAPSGSVIAFCEGEKDAIVATDIFGYGTTTIHGGAYYDKNGKLQGWRESYKAPLAGHHVILFEHNDRPGRNHVNIVARMLQGVAASVRVVRFRDKQKVGYDLADYVEDRLGGSIEEWDGTLRRDEIKAELLARAVEWKEETKKAPALDEFVAYLPQHDYIYLPTRAHWPAASVNSQIPPIVVGTDDKGKDIKISASAWLDQNHAVEQKAWAPGEPEFISNKLVVNGGWVLKIGATCFNEYLPSAIELGDASKAGPWLEFVKRIYPKDHEHIINYFASKVQHPEVKINHCLLLGGAPGIGKDTLIEPLIHAIGPHNFQDISPKAICSDFNGWAKGVVVRISELRDLGDISRFDFYEHSKTLMASPPEVVRINEKHIREYYAFNVCGVVMTTNHKAGGIYLPPDDRRHYVAWSEVGVGDISEDEFNDLWGWYRCGGFGHVAAYLSQLDISGFDPKAKPPKTDAFWDIVNSNRSNEENELSDLIEEMGDPPALTVDQIRMRVGCESLAKWLADPKNGSGITRRLEKCGYTPVNNPNAPRDKQWKIVYGEGNKKHDGTYEKTKPRRKTVYARKMMKGDDGIERPATEQDRLNAAEELVKASRDNAPHDQPQNRM